MTPEHIQADTTALGTIAVPAHTCLICHWMFSTYLEDGVTAHILWRSFSVREQSGDLVRARHKKTTDTEKSFFT